MESSDTTLSSSSLSSSPTSPPPTLCTNTPPLIASPCAACKILRRRCIDKCVLAPYFPPTDPRKFTIAHRVFGASNIIKFLQELPESQRSDAVSSMVYEASARIRDPVYGCAGAIFQLQKQVGELSAQLAQTQAELVNTQTQHANLLALICMEMAHSHQQQQLVSPHPLQDFSPTPHFFENDSFLLDDCSQGSLWEDPLWT